MSVERQIEELVNIIGWCRRRLHPRLHAYVDEMLASASVGRNAERQDRNGLGPKDEHAVGEARDARKPFQ